MSFEKISKIYFSPSSTTKTITNKISDSFNNPSGDYDLLSYNGNGENFNEDELVIIGMPVFGGRIPKIAREKLEKFKGLKTPAIIFVNRGNANVGDALLELLDLVKDNGFRVIGAAIFVSQHSIFNNVARGRPDEDDLEKASEFAMKCLENIDFNGDIEVVGKKPYKDYSATTFIAGCDEMLCSFCYDCISICPQGAIPEDDPVTTDETKCDGCSACIHICGENARKYINEDFDAKAKVFEDKFSKRGEVEFFF